MASPLDQAANAGAVMMETEPIILPSLTGSAPKPASGFDPSSSPVMSHTPRMGFMPQQSPHSSLFNFMSPGLGMRPPPLSFLNSPLPGSCVSGAATPGVSGMPGIASGFRNPQNDLDAFLSQFGAPSSMTPSTSPGTDTRSINTGASSLSSPNPEVMMPSSPQLVFAEVFKTMNQQLLSLSTPPGSPLRGVGPSPSPALVSGLHSPSPLMAGTPRYGYLASHLRAAGVAAGIQPLGDPESQGGVDLNAMPSSPPGLGGFPIRQLAGASFPRPHFPGALRFGPTSPLFNSLASPLQPVPSGLRPPRSSSDSKSAAFSSTPPKGKLGDLLSKLDDEGAEGPAANVSNNTLLHCRYCSRTFRRQEHLMRHVRTHVQSSSLSLSTVQEGDDPEDEPMSDEKDDEDTAMQDLANAALKLQMSDERPRDDLKRTPRIFKCSGCKSTFKSRKQLTNHLSEKSCFPKSPEANLPKPKGKGKVTKRMRDDEEERQPKKAKRDDKDGRGQQAGGKIGAPAAQNPLASPAWKLRSSQRSSLTSEALGEEEEDETKDGASSATEVATIGSSDGVSRSTRGRILKKSKPKGDVEVDMAIEEPEKPAVTALSRAAARADNEKDAAPTSTSTDDSNEDALLSEEDDDDEDRLSGRSGRFKCKECCKTFPSGYHLRQHIRTHTGERPFKCPHCSRAFRQKGHLTRHILIHTGEKPYPCPHCDASFRQSNSRDKHVQRIHQM